MQKTQLISLIGYVSGVAANDHGCKDGPTFLKESNFLQELNEHHLEAAWVDLLYPSEGPVLSVVAELCKKVAQETHLLTQQKKPFALIGGDHSSGVGTWSGVKSALPGNAALGLIWIDAHLDAHTPETSETGNIHGMPVASLLGYGPHELTNLFSKDPKIKAENLCMIGIRSFERGEQELITSLGVKVYYMDEIRQRGINVVLQEAIKRVSANTVGYGLSIDLDGIDPKEAPGVGSPAPNGISGLEFCQALVSHVRHDQHLLGIEIAEFNPHRDIDNRTYKMIQQLLRSIF